MRRIHFDNKYGYESLAESIVLQAVKDYIRSYRVVLRNPDNYQAAAMMKECEDFIESRWFRMLCDLDPEELLYRLDKEIEADYYRRRK
ncbi:MAG: hypothetical protein J6D57_06535 [Mogibacterium sp.]|nr:hypothetical protein [Mogibacterium sp.]